MKDIELTVNKETGFVSNVSSYLIQQENLQRKIIFKFKEGFVDGNAYLCIEKDSQKGKIQLVKNNNQYETEIRSNIVNNTKSINLSLKIYEAENEDEEIPIFVSKIVTLKVAETLVIDDDLPEDLPTWQELVNGEISQLELEVENLDDTKQANLVSGTNIKTINNQSILGEGNITITAEEVNYNNILNKPQINNVTLSGNKTLANLGIQPAGNYALSSDIPTVPTNISAFTNDVGYITSYTETDPIFTNSPAHGITNNDISNWNNKSDFSGNYNDLTNKPTIPTVPTNISSFTNDVGYLTEHQDITGKEDKTNKTTTIDNESTNTQYPSAKAVYDYVEGLNTYSTDEVKIGTWFGKPLYRKVYNITNIPKSRYDYQLDIDNTYVVNTINVYYYDDNRTFCVQNPWYEFMQVYLKQNNVLRIEKNTIDSWTQNCYVILEYTKTTD